MSVDVSDPKTVTMFAKWFQGDMEAVRLLIAFCDLARAADDVTDGDNDRQDHMSTILELSLVTIPANRFYQAHMLQLSGIVMEAIVYWKLSDKFRLSNDTKREEFGFVYRESTDRIAVAMAALIGGSGHATMVAEEIFATTHALSEETVSDWVKGD